jgi:phosphate transport system protein
MILRIKFHQKLDELRERLLVMAGMVEQAIQRATEAYATRDIGLCNLVKMSEPAIDRMEREIDQLALDLLAMEQPTAVDLRFILSVIRINADLERVGDQALNIAHNVRDLQALPVVELPVDIVGLARIASAMVRRSLQSFIDRDKAMAQSVLMMDDEVDLRNHEAFRLLSDRIKNHPESTSQALHVLVIARNLERVGDHATNIAEDVIFWVTGADVRHSDALAAAEANAEAPSAD